VPPLQINRLATAAKEPQERDCIISLKLVEANMGFGRGALLWMIGIPLPIILLLFLFWR
jgi:hypothetical protein